MPLLSRLFLKAPPDVPAGLLRRVFSRETRKRSFFRSLLFAEDRLRDHRNDRAENAADGKDHPARVPEIPDKADEQVCRRSGQHDSAADCARNPFSLFRSALCGNVEAFLRIFARAARFRILRKAFPTAFFIIIFHVVFSRLHSRVYVQSHRDRNGEQEDGRGEIFPSSTVKPAGA